MKQVLLGVALGAVALNVKAQTDTTTVTKIPFEDIDQTWQNGNDRRDSSVFKNVPYFTPSILMDINYTHSFNNPNDNTVVGSTALARNNEIQLSALHFGGDFVYKNARARVMTQFGTRSIVVPRNDYSPYRGQYQLANVYRYLSEAYAGYHIDKWYGINIDAGMFMSYIGLNSYYQPENWEYQASFTSDNTPWFFNGVRIQIFPTKHLKFEPWLINGWQSYGKFNSMPGFGFNLTWMPTSNLKMLTNNYYGSDAACIPDRKRFHSDNSILVRYLNKPKSKGISRMAFSWTGDIGFEKGGGVNGFKDDAVKGPAQYFLSSMFYNRIWFNKNRFAWTVGGGVMKNPGRYLVLYPTGQASPLPNPLDPTKTEGAFPFSANPGDQFFGWDWSTNFDYMPNQSITFRAEFVNRHADVPYFAGQGGVTSQTGYSTSVLDPNWRPDLVKQESRFVLAILFRL
ncbi:Putative beta-barrel porin-2, OmpL-like. bbp2 [Filimonas lacunae]|uniref:Putative beta-barrel porin-2, OmpL-like. bbp2 n=1 Tax=Filimonas lacunae TaxID=477680 RepID=A0A173MIB2_9BACT|nr:outer membrane beta-barrel protein [Filimonas lacunae]BAV07216.1 outer membrane protein [Filimonas lacunae]SIS93139.1 Putative beta-barrel porin-2, OmpL-like. bbp2 [Filimonas lacunae]